MKKIGLWGFYGEENFGDDMLLRLLLEKIENKKIEKEVYIFGKKCDFVRGGIRQMYCVMQKTLFIMQQS